MIRMSSENTSPLSLPSTRTVPSKVSLPSNAVPRPSRVLISLTMPSRRAGAFMRGTLSLPQLDLDGLLGLARPVERAGLEQVVLVADLDRRQRAGRLIAQLERRAPLDLIADVHVGAGRKRDHP